MADVFKMHELVASEAAASRCPYCGGIAKENVIQRGVITITSDPDEVFLRGRRIPLSPTEMHVFRSIAVRGRASYTAIDEMLASFGSAPATRAVVLRRIRQKFMAAGGEDPLPRLGRRGVGLNAGQDRQGAGATIIGLQMAPDTIAQLAHA